MAQICLPRGKNTACKNRQQVWQWNTWDLSGQFITKFPLLADILPQRSGCDNWLYISAWIAIWASLTHISQLVSSVASQVRTSHLGNCWDISPFHIKKFIIFKANDQNQEAVKSVKSRSFKRLSLSQSRCCKCHKCAINLWHFMITKTRKVVDINIQVLYTLCWVMLELLTLRSYTPCVESC